MLWWWNLINIDMEWKIMPLTVSFENWSLTTSDVCSHPKMCFDRNESCFLFDVRTSCSMKTKHDKCVASNKCLSPESSVLSPGCTGCCYPSPLGHCWLMLHTLIPSSFSIEQSPASKCPVCCCQGVFLPTIRTLHLSLLYSMRCCCPVPCGSLTL